MAEQAQYHFINNRIIPASEAGLLLSDLGLFRGYGVFDYFRTHGGKPFLMKDYFKRFRLSAAQLGLMLQHSDQELESIVAELVTLNGRPESGVRLLLTGGYSENIFTPGEPNLIIRIEKSVLPEEKFYTQGIKLVSTEYLRDFPSVKTTNYLQVVKMWPEVEKAGATELLYTWDGNVLECSRSNFFIIENGRLLTAPAGQVLGGVTRNKVIEVARELNIPVDEAPVPLEKMKTCQEAFITGTTKRVMPVVQVDKLKIGSGKPGSISLQLMDCWQKLEQENAEKLS